jgi:hypothetical protein
MNRNIRFRRYPPRSAGRFPWCQQGPVGRNRPGSEKLGPMRGTLAPPAAN